jgi:GAF domain-containing protein
VTHEERLARLFLDPIVNEYGYFWIGIYRVTQAGATRLTFRGDVPPCREFAFGHGNVGQAAETGQRKVIPDVSKDPQYSQCFIATKSEMVQPVLFRGARVGVIDAESDREGFFDAWQQQVLGLLAQRLAPVLAWPDLELALACAEAVDRLQERFAGRFAWTGVYALAPHGDLQLVSFLGPGTEHTRIPLNRGVCGAAVRENAVQNVADVRSDPRFIACSLATRSELVVPIRDASGAAVAEIDVDSDQPGSFPTALVAAVEAEAAALGGLFRRN